MKKSILIIFVFITNYNKNSVLHMVSTVGFKNKNNNMLNININEINEKHYMITSNNVIFYVNGPYCLK